MGSHREERQVRGGASHPVLGGDGRMPGGGYNQVRTDWWNKLAGKGGAEAQEGIAHHFGMAAVERERKSSQVKGAMGSGGVDGCPPRDLGRNRAGMVLRGSRIIWGSKEPLKTFK